MNELDLKDTTISKLYNEIVSKSQKDPFEDAVNFLNALQESAVAADCIRKLRIDISSITSNASEVHVIEKHLKFLLLVQFEHAKSRFNGDSESVDYEFCEWAAELLERLGVCARNRADWKEFIQRDLVERFKDSLGKTLTQIYLNIGLEPPQCLPKIEGNTFTSDTPDSPTFDHITIETPVKLPETYSSPLLSPRSSRYALRSSLPRALFTDPVVASTQKNSNSSSFTSSANFASTPFSEPAVPDKAEPFARLKSGGTAPKLVLMPMSSLTKCRGAPKTRRKARTPVKLDLNFIKGSPVVESHPRSFKSRLNSRKAASKRSTPSRRIEKSRIGRRMSGHRSVLETPNPKMSHPRWERARLAAAEKTKHYSLIVAESPIKPAEVSEILGSPLRRLRRASSFLSFDGGQPSIDNSDSCLQSRAERWQKKQQQDEASLSHFGADLSGGENTLSNLSQPPSLRRRHSNLLANLSRSPQVSSKLHRPSLNSIVSSPSILSMAKHSIIAAPELPISAASPQVLLSAPSMSTTTPKNRRSCRLAAESREVPISPQVYDEEAMFLGQEEFFRQTTPVRQNVVPRNEFANTSPKKESLSLNTLSESPLHIKATSSKGLLRLPPKSPTPFNPFSNYNLRHHPSSYECTPEIDRESTLTPICVKKPSVAKKTPQKGLFGAAPISDLSRRLEVTESPTATGFRTSPSSPPANTRKLRPRRSLFQ